MLETDNQTIHLSKPNITKILPPDPQKYIFWCGAGVSAEAPTELPLGNTLTRFVLSQLVNNSFSEEIEVKLTKLNNILKEYNIEIGKCLRLESVITEVSLIENNIKSAFSNELKFISTLSSFGESPFNLYHLLLAKLVIQGSNVVTTNYDFGIEKALEYLCPGEYSLEKYSEGQYAYSSNDEKKGKIFHIHGIAQEPRDIGITYHTVSRSFHNNILNVLDSWMNNDYYFTFLGYSCGDNYDVERYFEGYALSGVSVKAKTIYVQRSNTELKQSVKRHLNCFPESYVVTYGIITFLKTLFYDLAKIQMPSETKAFDWRSLVSKQIYISNEMRGLLFFRICKLVGINPTEFKFYDCGKNGLETLLNAQPSHIEEYIVRLTQFNIYKNNGDAEACYKIINETDKDYNQRYNTTYFYPDRVQYDMNEVLVIKRDYQTLKKQLPNVEKIIQGIHEYHDRQKTIGWEFSTPLHQHTMIIIDEAKHFIAQGKVNLPDELIENAKNLLYCNDLLIRSKLEHFEEINQFCVALRIKALLLTLIYGEKRINDIEKCISSFLELYAKESSVQGVMMSMRDYSTILYFLYAQTQKFEYFSVSNKIFIDVQSMQGVINSKFFENEIISENKWRNEYEASRG